MPNSTRRRVGHRAASPANMHENTRSRTATASGGTPSLAREEADDEAAALIRQADGDTTGAAVRAQPRKHARLTVACLRAIRARAESSLPGSVRHELGYPAVRWDRRSPSVWSGWLAPPGSDLPLGGE